MHNKIHFGYTVSVETDSNEKFHALVDFDGKVSIGWLAALSPAYPGNKLNVFYSRAYINPVEVVGHVKTYQLEDGVYEVETVGSFGPHRYAFSVVSGQLEWSYSMTFSKRLTLEKIAEALSPEGV